MFGEANARSTSTTRDGAGERARRARWRTASCRRRGRCRSRRYSARRRRPAAARPRSHRWWCPAAGAGLAAAAARWRRPAACRVGADCAHVWSARPALASGPAWSAPAPGTGVVSICSGAARGLSPLSSAPGHHERHRQAERAERRDQHDRHLLREKRDVRHHRPRDDARVGGRRRDAVARGRLAVLGEIGFEQIALRLGLALERAQLHVLVAGRGGLALELIERWR